MNALSLFEWQSLAANDPEAWGCTLRENIAECIQKTNTSVVSDSFVSSCVPGAGSLSGVPYGLKDLFDVRGSKTHASSVLPLLLAAEVTSDAELVQRMASLGASCAVKTQMNEFAYGLSGENPHYGDCAHPFLAGCLSGGSSSGSAHAVAAGYLPLAFGTDTGGSIRLPSAWCGVYGIRWQPEYFMDGGFPLAPSLDTMGWFTRSSEEMAYVLRAWFDKPEAAGRGTDLKGVLFLPEDLVLQETHAALHDFSKKVGLFESRELFELRSLLPKCQFAFNVLQSREAYVIHADWLEAYGDLYDPAVKARILRAKEWTTAEVDIALEIRGKIKAWFTKYFETRDFLAMPICPGASVPLSEAKPELREQTLQLTTPASLAGLPALSIPVWLDAKRTVGIQFIFKETAPELPLAILDLCKNI